MQEGAGRSFPLHDRQMQASEPLHPLTATWLHPVPAPGTLPLRRTENYGCAFHPHPHFL